MRRCNVCDIVLVAIVTWFLFGCVSGAEYRADEPVAADEVIEDDLYIFGDEVTIDGEVKGDLVAFGRLIRMNGLVEGDLICAAQAIVIAGRVGDDVRCAGQIIKLESDAVIVDDMIATGLSLECTDASTVEGDLVYAGYQALLAGDVGGVVNAALVNCEVSGRVGGDLKLGVAVDGVGAQAYTSGSPPPIAMPTVPPGLTIGDTAQIEGDLKYDSPAEAKIADAAKIVGEIQHEIPEVQADEPPTLVQRAVSVSRKYAGLLIIGCVFVLLAPRWTRQLSNTIQTRPLASIGLGAAGIVGFIVALVVILVAMVAIATLVGYVKLTSLIPAVVVLGLMGLAALIVGFWFFASYLAKILLSLLVGRWLLRWLKPAGDANRFLTLLVGLLLLALLSLVPYLAWAVNCLAIVLGVGAIVVWMFWKPPADVRPAVG